MEKRYYIYLITNKINSKQYVGFHSTTNINDNYMGSGMAINNAYKKYGVENFTKEILEYCDEYNWADREKFWIKNLNTLTNGYNLTQGGEGVLGLKHTKSTKEKMSKSKKGSKLSREHKSKISQSMKGINNNGGWNKNKKWNQSVKDKMSVSHTNKIISLESKAKMSDSKKNLYENKIKHPRSKIFIVHKPDGSRLLCIGTFRKFRDKHKTIYNKYFKIIINSDVPIDGWYFKEYQSLSEIININDYILYD